MQFLRCKVGSRYGNYGPPKIGPVGERVCSDRAMKRWTAASAVLLTPLVWPVGVVLLWLSEAWSGRDKLIGSLLLPGGLAFAWLIATETHSSCLVEWTGPCQLGTTYSILHPGPAAFNHVFGAVVFVLAVVVPILTSVYLGIRLRSRWSSL